MGEINVEFPKLSWEERYRRMLDIAYTAVMTADQLIHDNVEDQEKAWAMVETIHSSFSRGCAKRLIQKYNLKPTVEDALKLFLLYSCEVWGYGATEYVSAKLEGPKRGVYANLVCRGWELAKRSGTVEMLKKLPCSRSCFAEYKGLLTELSPALKLTMTKAYPWGNDRCEFVIES
jgi:hypothetical protein